MLQAAGLLFFAFAGYARVATLGEEVRDPARTIPRAVPIALGITLVTYLLVALAALLALGPDALAAAWTRCARWSPWAGWTRPSRWSGSAPRWPRSGRCWRCCSASPGPRWRWPATATCRRALAAVHPRWHVPHRAEVAIGLLVAALVLTVDLRGAIGFSSFAVLTYYAIANASALTLPGGPPSRLLPVVGLAGCVLLAVNLPWPSVVAGAAVLAAGAALWAVRHRQR